MVSAKNFLGRVALVLSLAFPQIAFGMGGPRPQDPQVPQDPNKPIPYVYGPCQVINFGGYWCEILAFDTKGEYVDYTHVAEWSVDFHTKKRDGRYEGLSEIHSTKDKNGNISLERVDTGKWDRSGEKYLRERRLKTGREYCDNTYCYYNSIETVNDQIDTATSRNRILDSHGCSTAKFEVAKADPMKCTEPVCLRDFVKTNLIPTCRRQAVKLTNDYALNEDGVLKMTNASVESNYTTSSRIITRTRDVNFTLAADPSGSGRFSTNAYTSDSSGWYTPITSNPIPGTRSTDAYSVESVAQYTFWYDFGWMEGGEMKYKPIMTPSGNCDQWGDAAEMGNAHLALTNHLRIGPRVLKMAELQETEKFPACPLR